LAEVEVDVETGQVTVLCIIAAHDVGRAINPLGVIGQIEGGVVMGMGLGLKEELPMAEGQPLITDFSGYHIPNSEELPDIRAIIVQKPASEGPYGAKGIGEIPSIPTAAAITNAIYQACGVRLYRIPATPERVLEALAAHDPDIYR
jgi:CO/xanthine dehydrogenase Mo-binding subunit